MINEKYSFKDFTHQTFLDVPKDEFTGIIRGSCFYHEVIDSRTGYIEIFPRGIVCTFENCNLDNVFIPSNCIIKGGCHRHIKVQNDRMDWETDEQGNPLEPIAKKLFEKYGIPTDPKYIPETMQDEDVIFIVRDMLSGL